MCYVAKECGDGEHIDLFWNDLPKLTTFILQYYVEKNVTLENLVHKADENNCRKNTNLNIKGINMSSNIRKKPRQFVGK